MTDVFMSYSSQNGIHAKALCDALEKEGLSVWIAPRNIPAGAEYGEEIIKGIETSKVFVLCLSKDSVQSQHVLREVERAVNRNMTIIVYQMEEVTLTKSFEYFLASTQWFIPEVNGGIEELVRSIREKMEKTNEQTIDMTATEKMPEKPRKTKKPKKKKGKLKIAIVIEMILAVVVATATGVFLWQGANNTPVEEGQTFTFGELHLQGIDQAPIEWMVLSVDEETDTALCMTEKVIAFGPYDGAESATRGQYGDIYYQEEKLADYTPEQLTQFWGSSDWKTSNIRTWLNSTDIHVEYMGQYPTEDASSLYENAYVHRVGFLYNFTEKERNAIVPATLQTVGADGEVTETKDCVYLLSKEEVEQYFTAQNKSLLAGVTEQAEHADGTGIYAEYKEQGITTASWGLRSAGDIPSCTVLLAGSGMSYEEDYHSEYACSSLMGIRPVMRLKLDAVRSALQEVEEY